MLSGMQNENFLYSDRLIQLTEYTSSQSSERHISSINPLEIFKGNFLFWPFMIITMNTVLPKNLIPSLVITLALCLAFFAVNIISCLPVAITIVAVAVCVADILSIHFKTVSRFMPQCICRDFFIPLKTSTKFTCEKQRTAFCKTSYQKINSCL